VSRKPCFGKEWEGDDPVCDECIDEYSCKDTFLRRRRQQGAGIGVAPQRGGFNPNANQVDYGYRTNRNYILPAPGEHPAVRVGKNLISGAFSAMGGEICVFFQEWRFPFSQKEPTKPQPEEPPPPPPPPKSGITGDSIKQPTKRKLSVTEDEDDLMDIDLD